MFFGCWTCRRTAPQVSGAGDVVASGAIVGGSPTCKKSKKNAARALSRFSLGLVSACLLVGCSDTSSPLADVYANYEPAGIWTPADAEQGQQPESQLQTVGFEATPTSQPVIERQATDETNHLQLAGTISTADPSTDSNSLQNPYWSFETSNSPAEPTQPPQLLRLPAVAEVVAETVPITEKSDAPAENDSFDFALEEPAIDVPPDSTSAGKLLAPQPISSSAIHPTEDSPELPWAYSSSDSGLEMNHGPVLTEIPVSTEMPDDSPLPALAELSEQERQLAALLEDASSAATGVLTDSRISELAKTKIQHAYAMASRNAMYVARQELIEVLRMISQAKDAQFGTPERTVALAAGLRALREAVDFAPRGTQLEAELDIAVLCASHRTPVAKQEEAVQLPRLMMDRYLRYAQLQLAVSVAGEPAGSMALHALGKLSSQLGRSESQKNRLADRHAIAYQQAALLAHNQNYLAAHELGVLLANSGHFAEAEQLLLQVANRDPNAIVFRNLARVQEKLGQTQSAFANRDHARQLSQQGATGTNNIVWVDPSQFAQTGVQTPRQAVVQPPAPGQLTLPGSRQVAPQMLRR